MSPVESVVQAVLYEGYMLYPYRPSSVKYRQRSTFGGVYPRAYSQASGRDPWLMQSEFLVCGDARTRVALQVGFLQVIERIVLDAPGASHGAPASEAQAWRQVPMLDIDGRRYYPLGRRPSSGRSAFRSVCWANCLAHRARSRSRSRQATISRRLPTATAWCAVRCGARAVN